MFDKLSKFNGIKVREGESPELIIVTGPDKTLRAIKEEVLDDAGYICDNGKSITPDIPDEIGGILITNLAEDENGYLLISPDQVREVA